MTKITLTTALLSTFSRFKYFPFFAANWDPFFFYELNYDFFFSSSFLLVSVSFSGCVFHSLSVHCGDNVTLQCANFTRHLMRVFWFKLNANASSIASMKTSDSKATIYDGFQNGKFNMSSDSVTLILTIKQVNSSDSGLYFCGFKSQYDAVIQSATYLRVEGKIALSLNMCQN